MKIQIPCPWLCQYDNKLYPGGSCNMTSVAMALEAYGCAHNVKGPHSRVADNLLQYCDDTGRDRHKLEVIDFVLEKFGVFDSSSYRYDLGDVKAHIKKGELVIVQGEFTPSGHILVVCGVDEEKGRWCCNDPAGYWPNYSGQLSGDHVWYDSSWFRPHAAPDGKVWAHLLSRAK